MSLRTLTGVSLALISTSVLALDWGEPVIEGEDCNYSVMYEDYVAPKRLVAAGSEVLKGVSPEQLAADQAALHARLMATQPELAGMKRIAVELTESDRVAIGELACDDCFELRPEPRRYQVGVEKPLGLKVDFRQLDRHQLAKSRTLDFQHGRVTLGLDGEIIWTAVLHSGNATGLRIGLDGFKLPTGAEAYVYTDYGEAFGPYVEWGPNDTGEFVTNTVVGETVYLQVHHHGDSADLGSIQFQITGLGHIGSRWKMANVIRPEALGDKAFCDFNEDCIENANCGNPSNAVSDARAAVAEMIYRSGGGYYICTGGLMADTDTGSVVPYFLTANHCINKGGEASSLEAVFDFEVACNSGTCPRYGDPDTTFKIRTNGASILATNRTSDFTLLQLEQTPGGSRAFLGWTNAEIAFTNNASLYRISHPSGAPQAYSAHEVDTSKGTCRTWPRGNWIYSRDTVGATEGGSSGSPVVNSAGEVVGQLSGGCGTNVNVSCDADNNATVDGALAAYFGQVEPFLDPDGGSGDPGDPPGQCTLLPLGANCTTDSDCCSNKCKGPRGGKTCK